MPAPRKIDPDIKYFGPIRTSPDLTLIFISNDGSCVRFENSSVVGKDELVNEFQHGGKLLLAWTGKYRTDIFEITQNDLNEHYFKK